jgi:hypothetical protein
MRYNYQLHHVLIALIFQTALIAMTDNIGFATIVPISFYTGRELYQFYYKVRTKDFDWGGCVPVFVALVLVLLGHV